jgi:predicted ATPase
MAHIIKFKVARLAGRKDVYAAELSRDINIFYGVNGSGKTSLLKILHSAMQRDTRGLATVPFEWAEVTIHSVDYDQDFIATLHKDYIKRRPSAKRNKPLKATMETVTDIDESIRDMYIYRSLAGKELSWKYQPGLPRGAPSRWSHRYLPTYRLYRAPETYSRHLYRDIGEPLELAYDWEMLFEKNFHALWLSYSNRWLTEIQTIQGKGLESVLRRILTSRVGRGEAKQFDSKLAYERVTAFLARQGSSYSLGRRDAFVKRYKSSPEVRRVVNDISRIEKRIERAMASRRKLEQLIHNMFTGNKIVKFDEKSVDVETDDRQRIGLNSLSSGEKHALLIFLETLIAEVGTVLIDEPEISLHVDWQRELISDMRQLNPDAQLIVATHSPLIMSGISKNEIFRL